MHIRSGEKMREKWIDNIKFMAAGGYSFVIIQRVLQWQEQPYQDGYNLLINFRWE